MINRICVGNTTGVVIAAGTTSMNGTDYRYLHGENRPHKSRLVPAQTAALDLN